LTPPPSVLRAFGGAHTAIPLARETWRAGDVVVKRVLEPDEAEWCQRVMTAVVQDGFRVPVPIAADGEWLVDGWTACAYVDGLTEGHERLPELLDAANHFHDALPRPDREARAVLTGRRHRWAIADRVAWGEDTVDLHPRTATLLASVLEPLEQLDSSGDSDPQLVHGDIGGNVYFDADGTPVVLDFSPYIRPRRYADAIAVVDAMLWNGGEPELTELVGPNTPARAELLLRAFVFRLVAEDLGTPAFELIEAYERVLGWLRVTAEDGPSA
jgi:uncharacterized protein (TIGR02569 family)